MGRRTKQFEKS